MNLLKSYVNFKAISVGTAFLLASIVLLTQFSTATAVCHAYRYNADDCGVIEEIPGDARTQIPWTVGIFIRQSSQENYTFHATGTILAPTTIITVFTGPLEKLPRKIRGKFLPQILDNFLVAGGLSSGDLYEFDKHTQISQVSFIEPYLGQEEPNRDYHFVLIHLKTPLDFSTPYIRPICLTHFKLGKKTNETSLKFLHGGFAKKKFKNGVDSLIHQNVHNHKNPQGDHGDHVNWEVELKLQLVVTGTGYECVKTYEKYYNKHFPVGMFCSRVPNTNSAETQNEIESQNSCMLQGSSVIQRIGQQWYLAGLTALVRGRKAGICRNDTVYFNSRLSTALEWIERSLRCSPYAFACSDGNCIPLESVCNSERNCLDNNLDENDILCESNKKCESQGNTEIHQCNVVGGCISKAQVCDGFKDCYEGSDESPALCNKEPLTSRSSRDLSPNSVIQYCLPLPDSDGVHIEYISMNHNGLANCTFIPVSTFAVSKCKAFYKSKHLYSRVEQQCLDNGKWSEQMKFECEPDCGMLNQKSSLSSLSRKPETILPWHALLFNLNQTSQRVEFVCGATIIENQYLLTAGHCFDSRGSIKSYKAVLGAVSKNFSENLGDDRPLILEISNVWRPDEFNISTKDADIAIVKLKHPIEFGAQLRPACFSQDYNPRIYNEKATMDQLHSLAIAGIHVFRFAEIAEMACIPKDFASQNFGFRCVGHQNGTSVRQLDTGGGLVSPTKTKFGTRYVLKGIMSYEESFDSEKISQFTSVERYRNWISTIIQR